MDCRDASEEVPHGWDIVRRNQSKSGSSYYRCPATNQCFSTYEDLIRYVNYAKREKLSIYAPDFDTNESELKANHRVMHNPDHNQGVTKPAELSREFYASRSEVVVGAGAMHEPTHDQSLIQSIIAPKHEDYHPILEPNATNEVVNHEGWAFIWKDLANHNLAKLGVDLECELSLNPSPIGFRYASPTRKQNHRNQQNPSKKLICYQRRHKRSG